MVVINKSGGAGGEGFLDVKGSRNNPHKLVITLSNLFTTPLATGIPFSWKDITPVAMMALDEFVLWVNAETPYKSAKEYLEAAKKEPGKFRMGGTGSKQEDQIITVAIEKATGSKLTYIPFRGGGESRCSSSASMSTRGQQSDRSDRAMAGEYGAAALRVRRQAAALHRQGRQ
jgi:putative tricarboxylic transport membrane protein